MSHNQPEGLIINYWMDNLFVSKNVSDISDLFYKLTTFFSICQVICKLFFWFNYRVSFIPYKCQIFYKLTTFFLICQVFFVFFYLPQLFSWFLNCYTNIVKNFVLTIPLRKFFIFYTEKVVSFYQLLHLTFLTFLLWIRIQVVLINF